MKNKEEKTHESFGMVRVAKYTGSSEFFGSDIRHNGGVTIEISRGSVKHDLNRNWFHSGEELIRIDLSSAQFVDAITSGMNTAGVPCTIKEFNGARIPQIPHVEDKKQVFRNNMEETYVEYHKRLDEVMAKLDGAIGKKKAAEIHHDLKVLKSHIKSNTNFVMTSFNESMEKTVTEAKQSISNYLDSKVQSLGIEAMRNELNISITPEETPKLD